MQTDAFEELLCSFQTGNATPAELQQLEDLLSSHPELREKFAIEVQFEADLMDAYRFALAQESELRKSGSLRIIGRISLVRGIVAAGLAAALAIIFLITRHQGTESTAQVESSIAKVLATATTGKAEIQRGAVLIVATESVPLLAGDHLLIPAGNRFSFRYDDGSIVQVNEKTKLTIESQDSAKRLSSERGSIFVAATKQPVDKAWVIHTFSADAIVIGTAFELSVGSGTTKLSVAEGLVKFGDDENVVEVPALQSSSATPGRPPSAPVSIKPEEIALWRNADPTLVGYWKFDVDGGETASDSSGHGNHGTLVSHVRLAEGKIGRAMHLWSGGYINVENKPALNPNSAITLAAWINVKAKAKRMPIISKANQNEYNKQYEMSISSGKLEFFTANDSVSGATVLSPSVWHHAACTYDGKSMKIYIDGVLDASRVQVTPMTDNGYNIRLGADFGTFVSHFSGDLDECRIYNRALSASEIKALMGQ